MNKLAILLITAVLFAVLLVAVFVNLSPANPPQVHKIKEVSFNGTIDPDYTYAVQVIYASSLDTRACTSWSLFQGRSKSLKTQTYRPEINSGKHSITFPINELSPTKECNWEPRRLALCVGKKATPGKTTCNSLLNLGRSSTVSAGIPIDAYESSAEHPIKIRCANDTYDPEYLFCQFIELPDRFKKASISGTTSELILFPGLSGDNFPFERDHVYWLDISFLPPKAN